MWCDPAGVPSPFPGWLSPQNSRALTAVAQAKELYNFLVFKWKFITSDFLLYDRFADLSTGEHLVIVLN